MIRSALVVGVAGACTTASSPPAPADETASAIIASVFNGTRGTWVDLTHAFSNRTIYWPTDTLGFRHDTVFHGPTPGGWFYSAYRYSAAEHGGTHLDAPIHFAEEGATNDAIPLTQLIGPAAVVDVRDRVTPDYLVSVDDLVAWEAAHGRLPDGVLLLLYTGWDARYADRTAYLGTDLTGPDAVRALHFPGLSPEAAAWLVAERRVAAVGLDTPSIDRGISTDFGAHVILSTAGIPGFENLTNLGALPPAGSHVVALPMKIADGSGGPLRIVAFVP